MNAANKKILIICGPTATGKTAFAYDIALDLDGELVSADSRQVYKEMDIGTGKDIEEKIFCKNLKIEINLNNKLIKYVPYLYKSIPIWLYDIVQPNEDFSVAHYEKIAQKTINNILKRNKIPIIVGGTGLYIQSFISPIETNYIPPDTKLRNQLEKLSLKELVNKLKKVFPDMWKTLNESDVHNPRRLIRKFEIQKFLTNPQNRRIPNRTINQNNDIMIIGLFCENSIIYQKIDKRVDKRIKQGMLQEIQKLLRNGYDWDLPAMSSLGYRQWKELFINNEIISPFENQFKIQSIIQQWKYDEHAYARRQMTWFKKRAGINWVDTSNYDEIKKIKNSIMKWYNTVKV